MLRLLLLVLFTGLYVTSFAQPDFISVYKKNGRILKIFIPGTPIIFKTVGGIYIDGTVEAIRNDSVFVRIYDIRTFLTHLGVYVRDTIATYHNRYHYKDVERIKVSKQLAFTGGKIDKLLMYGGAGYFGLNLINAAIDHQPITSKENIRRLSIAAAAFGVGYLIKKCWAVNRLEREWYRINYVKMH